jgi:hypothetical protein
LRADGPIACVPRPRRPAGEGYSIVAATLLGLGYEVRPVPDPDFALSGDALVWMTGGPHWFPVCWRRLLAAAPAARPPVVLWHTEPLPLPRAAGLPLAPLHARELAKIVLRDARRNDPRSNFRRLRQLLERGLPHVLAVSTLERQEFLAEHGIDSEFVPYGYRAESHGRDLGLERDIDVLFLGSLDVPRRKRILRRLERDGVAVEAVGKLARSHLLGREPDTASEPGQGPAQPPAASGPPLRRPHAARHGQQGPRRR